MVGPCANFFGGARCVNPLDGVLYVGNPELGGTMYGNKLWYYLKFNDMMFTAFATSRSAPIGYGHCMMPLWFTPATVPAHCLVSSS